MIGWHLDVCDRVMNTSPRCGKSRNRLSGYAQAESLFGGQRSSGSPQSHAGWRKVAADRQAKGWWAT